MHAKLKTPAPYLAFCRPASRLRPREVSGGWAHSARQATPAAAATSSLLDSPPSSRATAAKGQVEW